MTNRVFFNNGAGLINYEQWCKIFKPVNNHFISNAAYNGCMFETYGEEVKYVESYDPNFVWTYIESDGNDNIVEGYCHVNRLGYFITKYPVTGSTIVHFKEEKPPLETCFNELFKPK